jgi:hypothetical protein
VEVAAEVAAEANVEADVEPLDAVELVAEPVLLEPVLLWLESWFSADTRALMPPPPPPPW